MPRLIDVLTAEEKALKQRIYDLEAEVRRLEYRKHHMEDELAYLNDCIEHAEQEKRRGRDAVAKGTTRWKDLVQAIEPFRVTDAMGD